MRQTTTRPRGRILRGALALVLAISASVAFAGLSSATPSKQDVEEAKAKLDALDRRMSLLVEEYNQQRLKLDQIRSKLADARVAMERAQRTAERATADLNARAATAYQGIGSEIDMLLSAESLADFSDRLEFLGSLAQSDADLATRAEHARQEAKRAAEDLAAAEAEQQQLMEALRDKESEIRAGIAEAKALYEELDRKYRDALAAQRSAVTAATGISPPPGGPPPAPNPSAQAAIDAAYSVIGTPYQWGGSSPETGFDCSGLTMWSWAHAGVSLPHSSAAQYDVLPHVARENLQPGDLVFFYTPISHVGLYIGGSRMIDANHPGDVVNIRPVNWDDFVGAARP